MRVGNTSFYHAQWPKQSASGALCVHTKQANTQQAKVHPAYKNTMRESSHTHLERVHQCQCGSQDACQQGARDEGRHAEPVKEHDNYYVLLYTSNKAVPK